MSENPMSDSIQFSQPTGPRPPDRRALLWNELERLHAQLGIDPPTATYSLEALAEEVTLARRAHTAMPHAAERPKMDITSQQQVGAVLEDACGDPIPDGQQEAAHRRTHKTWRNFYGPLFFGERPTSELYQSTPSEDGAARGNTTYE